MQNNGGSQLQVLYIVYWGAAEPLGQSLVLPAVMRLAASGIRLTLVTFEKPADLARADEISKIRASLGQAGVEWIPLQYHKRPKVPATAFDILQGYTRSIAASLRTRPDIIHARTFIGGLIGLALAPVLRAKVIYHNEGYYPDEQVDAGVWQAGSMSHRIARSLEQKLYFCADGIIALSHRSKAELEGLSAVRRKKIPVIVVPSCVDLDLFRYRKAPPPGSDEILRLIHIGSVGGRYILDRIGRFAAVASQLKQVHLRILTRTDPETVAGMLSGSGLSADAWSMDCVPYTKMPEQLAAEQAGLFFLTQGISEHGCSPTKIGEYWAVGLPVVTTPNVSDTDEIVRNERVGVVVREHTDAAYQQAAAELLKLLEDKDLSLRCRRAAEAHYALEPACERQFDLYQTILSRRDSKAEAQPDELTNV